MVGLQNLTNFEIKGGFTHLKVIAVLCSGYHRVDTTFFSVSDPHKFMRIRIQDPDPLFFLFRSGSKGGKIKEDNLNKQIFN